MRGVCIMYVVNLSSASSTWIGLSKASARRARGLSICSS